MNKIIEKFKALTRFQQALILVACLLAVLVAGSRLDLSDWSLPLPATIRRHEEELRKVQEQLARLESRRQEQEKDLRDLQRSVAPFFWRVSEKEPSVEIQAELERLARAEKITIRSMGSPHSGEISEHVRKVEISININGSMREIARFLAALDQSERKLYWQSCRLRPVQTQNFDSINLTGRVEAFFLAPGAELIIFGREG